MLRHTSSTGAGRAGALLILLSVMLLASVGAVYLAEPAAAASVSATGLAWTEGGNAAMECAQLDPDVYGEWNVGCKMDGTGPAYQGSCAGLSGAPTGGGHLNWSSAFSYTGYVIAYWGAAGTGPSGQNAYLFDYTAGGPWTGDTDLYPPDAPAATPAMHATFCYVDASSARLTVAKETDPDAGTGFSFTPSPNLPGGVFSLDDDHSEVFSGLAPDTYTVAETDLPSGWFFDSVSCLDDDTGADPATYEGASASVDLSAGQSVTCTFTNIKRLRLTSMCTPVDHFPQERYWRIRNETGRDVPFVLDVVGSTSDTSGVAPAGDSFWYTTAVEGANTTKLMVNGVQHDVKASNNNTDCYELTIEKVADPADGGVFSFTGDLGDFELSDPDGPDRLFTGLDVRSYTITEVVPEGWMLESVECDARDWEETEDGVIVHFGRTLLERTAVESPRCTFRNRQLGRILVDKVTSPGGSSETFGFDASWSEADFSLTDGADPHDSGYLEPGEYSVSEVLPLADDWYNTSTVCSAGETEPPMDPAAIVLEPGATVTCVFGNEYLPEPEPGRIIVRKVTGADDPAGSFTFVPSWGASFSLAGGGAQDSGPLPAGIYSVTETLPLGEGWSLQASACDDGSAVSAIGVSPGETVTCTFTNAHEAAGGPEGSLTIHKVAGGAGSTVFEFGGNLGTFELADGESQLFGELVAGEYLVSELLPAGWEFDRVECTATNWTDGDASVTVDLADGEAASCTFYNQRAQVLGPAGSLTIVKVAGGAGLLGFEFDAGDLGTFTLTDGDSELFGELPAASYTVTETAVGGWQFMDVDCDALNWTAEGTSVTVHLGQGEAAVCTFINGAVQGPDELPYTGTPGFLMPMLVTGLWVLLMGLALMVWSRVREADRS